MRVPTQRPEPMPLTLACHVLGLNRSTVYARRREKAAQASERQAILNRMNRPEFWDQTPYQVYHTLLERGECLGSLSTLYRVLREANQNQRAPQSHAMPRLTTTRPNAVWTKLATTRRGLQPQSPQSQQRQSVQ
jgi:putative transposase